ncbi:uncharacterized protein LOC108905523 [Anoplophora glabripennis]|uniref:uncharacterized protein LOC108905523 n=1 Tax=Anoplophora glabripennis TaxID=217634 RepID=UPI000873900B|nr:uncharacterized protein LOC108905523 [Anoplophora glabripennis]
MYVRTLAFGIVGVFILLLINTEADLENVHPLRNGKFFPFFGVGLVRFENGLCGGNSTLEGTCYTRRQCALADGVGTVRCASGIGICCIIQRTCGETSSLNNTYFVSPGFPTAYTNTSICTFTISRCNSDICQVRIDFLSFNLAQPNDNGSCVTDALIITGGASNVPVLCGENSGQHIYVDFNDANNIILTISTSTSSIASRAWNIKIAQIACNCPNRAPSGCTQYYTELSATVNSFNYGSAGSQLGTRQLVNENYGVCVAMLAGYCGIQWSQSGGAYSFTVTNNTYTNVGTGTIGTDAAAILGSNCTTDFVVIPAPIYINDTLVNTDRFCGNGFPTLISYSKPFVLTVVTNTNEINDTGNRGFSLTYTQIPCSGAALLG